MSIDAVAQSIVESSSDIEGLTISGGEPFGQAAAVTALIAQVRDQVPEISALAYTGFRLEWLRRRGTAAHRELLRVLDVLIDGPYRESMHQPLRWRGSANQRIHCLSPRHRDIIGEPDVSAGVEFRVESDGGYSWAGVPPIRGFRQVLGEVLEIRGVLTTEGHDER